MGGRNELLQSLEEKGFAENIVNAFSKVRREDFVNKEHRFNAYDDVALPLRDGATISQPSTIAFMLKLLDIHPGANILEIGSGSGYALALIAEIAPQGEIRGIEIQQELVDMSKKRLASKKNVFVHKVNGRGGFLRYAPYDRILVSASYPYIPYNLLEQLKINGVLVVPVGNTIVRLRKRIDGTSEKEYPGFAFVKMQ